MPDRTARFESKTLALPGQIGADTTQDASPRIRQIMAWLDTYEIPIVRKQTELIRNPALKLLAILFNQLGNGWLYPLWAGSLFFFQGLNAIPLITAAGLSLALAHLLYPTIKTYIARPRPDRSLSRSLRIASTS